MYVVGLFCVAAVIGAGVSFGWLYGKWMWSLMESFSDFLSRQIRKANGK